MKDPMVSVIIPTYNRVLLLKQALDSVFLQTFRDFEIIVADDGSTDGTDVFLKQLALQPGVSLRVLSLGHSGFPGAVRNSGAEEARGTFLAFLDCDDLWLPEKLERQTAFFRETPGFRICHTREQWLRGEKTVSQKSQKHQREGNLFSFALEKCILGPSTVMMETSLYRETGGFARDLEIAEDYEYWLRLTSRFPVGYLEEPLTVKRAGDWPQLSEKYGQIEIFRIRALKRLVDSGEFSQEQAKEARRILSQKCAIYAAGCLKRGRREEAAEYSDLANLFFSDIMDQWKQIHSIR